MKEFFSLCSERQNFIFGVYLLNKNAAINKDKDSKEYNNYFKKLTQILKITQATLYNEISRASYNLDFIIKKNEFNNNYKDSLISMIVDEYKNHIKIDGIK